MHAGIGFERGNLPFITFSFSCTLVLPLFSSILSDSLSPCLSSSHPLLSSVVQRHGAISFVDLAGSERTHRTKSEGQTLVETNNINKSLLTLGNCIRFVRRSQVWIVWG